MHVSELIQEWVFNKEFRPGFIISIDVGTGYWHFMVIRVIPVSGNPLMYNHITRRIHWSQEDKDHFKEVSEFMV